MDLTPQTLREVEFREKLRGYHPDDVDDFLEEVAVAVGQILTRLQAAESGLPPAPAPVAAWTDVKPAAPVPAPVPAAVVAEPVPAADAPTSDTLRRTLLLAQRTADLAISEAESSARQIVEHAEAEAARIKAEAQLAVSAMMDEATARTEGMVGDLEAKRANLEREIASLHTWASQHRDRIREALNDQIRSLDVWLSTNPPPRPTRPTPALRASSAGALPPRRALSSTTRSRPSRLGTTGTDDQPSEGGVLRRRGETSSQGNENFATGETSDSAAVAADDTANEVREISSPDQRTDAPGATSDGSSEDAESPVGSRDSGPGGLGSRLYRRR